MLTYSSQQPFEIGNLIIPISQMKKLSQELIDFIKVTGLIREMNLGPLIPEFELLSSPNMA